MDDFLGAVGHDFDGGCNFSWMEVVMALVFVAVFTLILFYVHYVVVLHG